MPFAFIPCAGSYKTPKPGLLPTRVRSLPERIDCEITFPKLLGYRYEVSSKKLTPDFSKPGCHYSLSTADLPSSTTVAPIIGQSNIHTLDDLRSQREQEVVFLLA
ncbi:MAG: restriction endonuclease subunit R, partial [Nostoc sp. C3-bin3]|nr:restriction endonuclease subunit R [Nostoc sp. C3-bin3]